MPLSLIVHGGAWDGGLPPDEVAANKLGLRRAALEGWQALQQGRSALDAVEAAIRVLEDDPSFDAGRGSFLNAQGLVELDASIMDGADLNTGAVAAVQRVRHPITLARRVLESEWALLVGEGATRFAEEAGLELCNPFDLVTPAELDRWKAHAGKVLFFARNNIYDGENAGRPTDTVGAVAMDAAGHIAAGTSTGGPPNKPYGRVGDSPLIACGTYADDTRGGTSVTGPGENVIRVALAYYAVDLLGQGVPVQEAAQRAMQHLARRAGGVGGIILIDRAGEIGRARSTSYMGYALMREGMREPQVGI